MSGVWALLPFKGAEGAKRRLAPVLTASEREGLVLAMVRDVLEALTSSASLAGVLVVSRDPIALRLAREFGAEVYADNANDLSGAVREASHFAESRHSASGTLFVPGDVPLIRADDVDVVLAGHDRVTLVPDAYDVGTNAAASSPPNAFEYLFDGKSFKPHIASARRAGIEARIVRRTAFGLDVDTIAELMEVAARSADTRTGTFLTTSGVRDKLRCRTG